MGGAAPTPTGKGGKKPLDAAINLVPFIDLLSCCISFLLITAVWAAISAMPASVGGDKGGEVPGEDDHRLTMVVHRDGYTVGDHLVDDKDLPRLLAVRFHDGGTTASLRADDNV